jgi:cation:H+ antiporter
MIAESAILSLGLILLGFVVLTQSASIAIKIIVKLAHYFGVSEFIVSFLLVGIISIFPELTIGIISAIEGKASLGLGVVIGSNIADLTLIMGIVALTAHSIRLHESTIKEIKVLLFAVALPSLLIFDGELSRIDGAILVAAFIAYVFLLLKNNKRNANEVVRKHPLNLPKEIAILFLAIGALLLAGHFITSAAEQLSNQLSFPIFFIGSIIAIGTCLPELSVAVKATQKKHGELGFGDVLGNVFADSMASIGIIALIQPIKLQYPTLTLISSLLMLFGILFLMILFAFKKRITKSDGLLLIALYAVLLAVQFFAEFKILQAG